MLAPKMTPAGAPPTRSATAERAADTIASARPDAGKTPPRLATGIRIAWATARATFSGSNVPAGPSVCTKPSASAGNRPRTRATSSRPSPTPVDPSARWTARRTVPGTGQDGGMTAPGSGSEGSQQIVVVGPDGRPMGTMPMPQEGVEAGQDGAANVGDMVEEPAKVMRIGTMIKQLLEEVRA